jgi:excisionase family DNA binding protein
MSGLLTKRGAADYLAVSEKFIQRHRSELGGYVVGGRLRFRQAQIDAFLERQRLAPRRGAGKAKGVP